MYKIKPCNKSLEIINDYCTLSSPSDSNIAFINSINAMLKTCMQHGFNELTIANSQSHKMTNAFNSMKPFKDVQFVVYKD